MVPDQETASVLLATATEDSAQTSPLPKPCKVVREVRLSLAETKHNVWSTMFCTFSTLPELSCTSKHPFYFSFVNKVVFIRITSLSASTKPQEKWITSGVCSSRPSPRWISSINFRTILNSMTYTLLAFLEQILLIITIKKKKSMSLGNTRRTSNSFPSHFTSIIWTLPDLQARLPGFQPLILTTEWCHRSPQYPVYVPDLPTG